MIGGFDGKRFQRRKARYASDVNNWEYKILQSWWRETGRTDDYITLISYQHVWDPGGVVEAFAGGMTANLGSHGWELAVGLSSHQSLLISSSPQGNDAYGTFPVHQLIFKRPAE